VPFYYSFLVGKNCNSCPIYYNPGPNYIDDATNIYVSSNIASGFTNNGSSTSNTALEALIWGTTIRHESLFRNRLWIDPNLIIAKSDLLFYGNAHVSTFRPNDASFQLVTSDWNENIVTYSIAPSSNNSISVDMPPTTTTTENRIIDMKEYFEFWQQNPSFNFGVLFKLDQYLSIRADQAFFSSDFSDIARRPNINFNVFVQDSECQPHAELKRLLDGGFVYTLNGILKFTMDEEYDMEIGQYLSIKIFDQNHLILESSDINGNLLNNSIIAQSLRFDDNSWELDVSQISGIANDEYYILEVSNSKGDKRYIRFQYKN
jgi:hypothetical protein